MELKRALEIFEYNKAMLTCDMSISRDPEHQDVSPDYYGKDAEDLYNAIVCVEKYIMSAIPIEWIKKKLLSCQYEYENDYDKGFDKGWNCAIKTLLKDWEKENENN